VSDSIRRRFDPGRQEDAHVASIRRRTRTWWAGAALALLCAGDAAAWDAHSLSAQAGNPFNGDSSNSVADTSVDALAQFGVPGVNDFAYFAHAAADSDSGVLLAESLIDNGPGATSTTAITIASIEQWLDVQDDGVPVTVRFQLTTNLSADRVGTAISQAAARLDVTTLCGVYVEVSPGADTEVIDNCTDDYPYVSFQGSGSADAIQVTVTWQPGHLPTHIDFLAQVENEINVGFSAQALAQTLASGALSISVEGAASYEFTSPTFLTVPEPGAFAAAAVALGALAALALRRA
jgi:hypothetical protein